VSYGKKRNMGYLEITNKKQKKSYFITKKNDIITKKSPTPQASISSQKKNERVAKSQIDSIL